MERTRTLFHWAKWWVQWSRLTALDPASAMAGPMAARVSYALDWRTVRASLPRAERDKWVEFLDFGASSTARKGGGLISVGQLERRASADRRKAIWLAAFSASAMADREDGVCILELGTCLGSGAVSLILGAQRQCRYVGLEGSPELARMTKERIRRAAPGVPIDMHVGPFRDTLPAIVAADVRFDLVFLDGHHEGRILLEQWDQIRPRLNEGAWVLVDDIRWSGDMHAAWNVLVGKEDVLAFDLFRIGALRCCAPANCPAESAPRRVPLSLIA